MQTCSPIVKIGNTLQRNKSLEESKRGYSTRSINKKFDFGPEQIEKIIESENEASKAEDNLIMEDVFVIGITKADLKSQICSELKKKKLKPQKNMVIFFLIYIKRFLI